MKHVLKKLKWNPMDVEDKWCMETRFTSFDKVNYTKIYILT